MWAKVILLIGLIGFITQVDARLFRKNKYGALGLPRIKDHTKFLLQSSNVEVKWFSQKLDHTNSSNDQVWSQVCVDYDCCSFYQTKLFNKQNKLKKLNRDILFVKTNGIKRVLCF